MVQLLMSQVIVRLCLYFNLRILIYNALASSIAAIGFGAFVGMYREISTAFSIGLSVFTISGTTFGFAFGFYIYLMNQRAEMHLYRSHGISNFILVGQSFIFNTMLIMVVAALGFALAG